MAPLFPEEFFWQPTLELAPRLLGVEFVHKTPEGVAAGRIVEVEAYVGPGDRAAHSYGGRRTERTEVMFGEPGHLYVFQVYGMHLCCNVVSGPPGAPEAILLRALEPTEGWELMARRRGLGPRWQLYEPGRRPPGFLRQLAAGPARLTEALGVTREDYGWDLRRPPLYLRPGGLAPGEEVASGPRIGIDYAGEARDYPWRFWIKGNPFVSR